MKNKARKNSKTKTTSEDVNSLEAELKVMKESNNEEKKMENPAEKQLNEVDGANINNPIILPSLENKDIETTKASLAQLQRNFGILPSSI